MAARIATALTIIGILIGLIVYSQRRHTPTKVSGFIEADEIRVGSRLGGRVLTVYVQEGQLVEQGQKLVELEPFDLLQREQEAKESLAAQDAELKRLQQGFRAEEIAQAQARYEQFKARYDLLVAGPRPQEIEAAKGRLQLAESELTLAQQNHDRAKGLIDRQAISRAEFDAAIEQLDAARSLVVVRNEELELLELGTRDEEKREAAAKLAEAEQAWKLTQNGYRREEIEKARAARDASQFALNVVLEQKKELVIASPIQGVVEALDLQKGDLVPAGAPVLSVMDDQNLWIRVYVPQNRVGLQLGTRLKAAVDSFPNEEFFGEVTFISRQAEFTPSNVQTPEERSKQVFRVKLSLADQDKRLRPGMTVDVWLDPLVHSHE